MALAIGRSEGFDHGQRHRDRGDAQPAGEALLERVDFLAHSAAVADDAACPFEHPLALRGEILETRAAIDQEDAETLLELLDAGRKRRLGHAAGLGGPAEVLFARQREQEFELIDHNSPTTMDTVTRRARFAKVWKYLAQIPIWTCMQVIENYEESQYINRVTLLNKPPTRLVLLDGPRLCGFREGQ